MATRKKSGRSASKARPAKKKKAAPKKVSRKKSAVRKKAAKAKPARRASAKKAAPRKARAKKAVKRAVKKAVKKSGKKVAKKTAKRSAPRKAVAVKAKPARKKGVTRPNAGKGKNMELPTTDETLQKNVPSEAVNSVEGDTDAPGKNDIVEQGEKNEKEGVMM